MGNSNGVHMNKLHLAALFAAIISGPALAQNVQDKTAPQNPKDVTQASPANQGATDSMKDQTGTAGQGKETGAVDQDKHQGKPHKKSMKHHKDSETGTSGSNK
jgi:hypothetical protein